ncbi:MAG: HIT family protein [Planctomycetota bacterium]
MPEPTIFERIISGEIPSHRVYEDERTFAFLDINPLSHGHTLVVPRTPAVTLDELSEDDAAAIGRVLPRIARAVLAASGASSYNVLQNNGVDALQSVPHVHFHIIPRYPILSEGAGLLVNWKAGTLEEHSGPKLAADIAARLA